MQQAPNNAVNHEQERNDFEKFLKYFIYRAVQVIVQSRAGCKVSNSSKPFGGSADWFNLAINDIPELFTDTRKHLPSLAPILGDNKAFCLDILLGDGDADSNWSDYVTLESWSIRVDTAERNQAVRVCYMVYNRMSTLMKSILSVTRAVPTQRVATESQLRSGTKIYYKLYLGEPRYALLGEQCTIRRIGVVTTPFGTVSASCGYRTVFERSLAGDSRVPAAVGDGLSASPSEKEEGAASGAPISGAATGNAAATTTAVEKRHSYPPKRERVATRRSEPNMLSDSTRTAFDTLEDDETEGDAEERDRDRDLPFQALLTKARAPLRNITSATNANKAGVNASGPTERSAQPQSDRERAASDGKPSSYKNDEAVAGSLSQTVTPEDFVVVNYKTPLSLAETSSGEKQPADVAWLYSEFRGLQQGAAPLSFAEARGAPTVSALLDAFLRSDLPHFTQIGVDFDKFVSEEFAEQFAAFQKANELDDAE